MKIHGSDCHIRRSLLLAFTLTALLLGAPKVFAGTQKGDLALQILDAESDAPLPSVALVSGKYHTLSDASGRAVLDLSKLTDEAIVTFSLTGYTALNKSVRELKALKGSPKTVFMSFGTTALKEVAVEAEKPLPSSAAVGERLGAEALREKVSASLAEVLRSVKGLSMISSGTTSSVPVIQGMSGERILVVADGVRQEGQQWNADLGPDVDASGAGSITVLKGAESVRYGSDALGGVILVEQAPLPYGKRPVSGEISLMYGTNGRTVGGRAMVEGAFGLRKDFGWRIQGSYTDGGDRSTAKYILNNTGVKEFTLQAALGWKRPGYGAEVSYALTGHREGILYEAKMGNNEQLKERIERGQPLVLLPFSRNIDFPNHSGAHQYLSGYGFYKTDGYGHFDLRLSYQRDDQNEYHYRRLNRSEIPSVSLTLHNVQGQLKWTRAYQERWSTETGLQGLFSKNTNLPGTGVVPLIPNYVEASAGLYAIQKYHNESWGLEAGVRGDFAYLDAAGIDAYSQTYGGKRNFQNFTYTIGFHRHITPELQFVSNYGTAWRAPHVGELWSNGIDATGSLYLKGDDAMTSEQSRKWIASLNYRGPKFSAGIEGYLTWVGGYIYKEPTDRTFTVISGVYPLFIYRQTAASIHGADAELSWDILPRLKYHVTGGMIWAAERQTGRYLPYIPPFRLAQELSFSLPFWEKSFVEIGHKYVAEQKRFDPATDLIPYAPPAYNLFELRAGTTFRFKDNSSLAFLLSIENLLNLEYKEYTNMARYYSHEAGRDIRVSLRYSF